MEDALNPQESVVYVSTMHKAKGKQFDHVFVLLDKYELRNNEDARLLYVATTRAKSSLIVHDNSDIYQNISADIEFKREKDTNQYNAPETLELILSHKDVQLSGFKFPRTARKIEVLKTTDELVYGEVQFESGLARGLNAVTGENVLLFSRDFLKKLETYETKGYQIIGARVEYIVYWYNEELEQEYKVVLPRLVLQNGNHLLSK